MTVPGTVTVTGREPSFLPAYRTYLDYLCLYDPARLENMVRVNFDSTGVPCFAGFDRKSIFWHKGSDVAIIDYCTESLNELHNLKSFPPNRKYLIVTNGWWDINEYDFGYEYRILPRSWCVSYFLEMAVGPEQINSFIDKRYRYEDHKPNVFCSLIGIKKYPRDTMVARIKQTVSYHNYVLNYDARELGVSTRSADVAYDFEKMADQFSLLALPEKTWYDKRWTMPMAIFNSARLNFVVETNQWTHDFHLTEKTLKPLYIGQPFVVFAQRDFLKTLRELGFRTFGDLWSEEYDDIDDLNQRAQVIADLLDDLGRFDWNRHRQQLQEITDHNQQVLINLGSTLLPKQMQNISDTLKSCGWFDL